MKQIAVHADDFGLTRGTNAAIAELLDSGAINSTTIMANGPAFEDAISRFEGRLRHWSVGLHVNLTQFKPCGDHMALASICRRGIFQGRRKLFFASVKGKVRANAIEHEIEAQWARCESAGVQPAHLDCHQHAHAIPVVAIALYRFARRKGVPVRQLSIEDSNGTPQRKVKTYAVNLLAQLGRRLAHAQESPGLAVLSVFATAEEPSVQTYQQLLERSSAENIELMVHPAKVDADHKATTGISQISQKDFETLSSKAWRVWVQQRKYEFIPVAELLRNALDKRLYEDSAE